MRPLLQQFPKMQKKHDGSGCIKITPNHGNSDGQTVQQLYVHLSFKKATNPAQKIRNSLPKRVGDPQRKWKEQGTDRLKGGRANQFLLINPIERPTAVMRHKIRVPLIGEATEPFQKLRPGRLITNHCTAGSFMYRGLGYAF